MRTTLRQIVVCAASLAFCGGAHASEPAWPKTLLAVIEHTKPLKHSRGRRLPLYVLPISHSLSRLDDEQALAALAALDARGIGYTVDWNHNNFETSLAEGLRIGKFQQAIGQPVAVNANTCLVSFFDGSEATLHVDEAGNRFAGASLDGKLGCPFSLDHRVPIIKQRVERFLQEYKQAGLSIDFIFADWEIDGPIEWNGTWATCQRCKRCRDKIPNIGNFRAFQSRLRAIRSEIQRVAFGDNVTGYFPEAMVGNYGTYPHNGYRYWYDYFEEEADGVPFQRDQQARYREWAHEFDLCGYSVAMPVIYTWYRTFRWYDFSEFDYRWFYNMLRIGSNAGKHTDRAVATVPFVHWTTTAPPPQSDPAVRQFSQDKYQELLWHLLLRGHDTFFLWCLPHELATEIRLVHEVYAESLQYAGFLDRGTSVTFDVAATPQDIVSARLGRHVLVSRTHFGEANQPSLSIPLGFGEQIEIPPAAGLHIVPVTKEEPFHGLIEKDGRPLFAIGFYEMPQNDTALKEMAAAGVNLVRCSNRQSLDRAQAAGIMGWMPLGLDQGATDTLKQQVSSVVDHPALAVWEGPDEIIWTFTAYSFLKEQAGFTRDDWNDQKQIAVAYSEKQGARIMHGLREGTALVRQLDDRHLPIWMNEAADSDVKFARQVMPWFDITGCDYYAVRSAGTDLQSIGRLVDRWHAIGRGKPVWMVLQAFSWHSIKSDRGRLYPSFKQSRFMAYNAIVHGAKGVLYWGSNYIDEPEFRQSLYALTAELARLQPFLTGEVIEGVGTNVIDDLFDPPGRGVRAMLLKGGSDYLLILVNEDNHRHLGVDVTGLLAVEGRELSLLYGSESAKVTDASLVTRMQPFDVKLFCTTKQRFERQRENGRNFGASGQ